MALLGRLAESCTCRRLLEGSDGIGGLSGVSRVVSLSGDVGFSLGCVSRSKVGDSAEGGWLTDCVLSVFSGESLGGCTSVFDVVVCCDTSRREMECISSDSDIFSRSAVECGVVLSTAGLLALVDVETIVVVVVVIGLPKDACSF